ncbi:MAG TPA: archease [Streptosporangiaceae bacterium]
MSSGEPAGFDGERAGHRAIPHTADIAIEAWAPGMDECVGQAVLALVESFVAPGAAWKPSDEVAFSVAAASAEDLLVAVLDEVIYQAEVHGRIPVDTSIDERTGATEGRADVRFATVPAADVELVGAVPKAVALHELRFARTGGLWRCHVTIDV